LVDETCVTSGRVRRPRRLRYLPIAGGTADNQRMSRRFWFSLVDALWLVGAVAFFIAINSARTRDDAIRVIAGTFVLGVVATRLGWWLKRK
jgi:hypothetical protein